MVPRTAHETNHLDRMAVLCLLKLQLLRLATSSPPSSTDLCQSVVGSLSLFEHGVSASTSTKEETPHSAQ